MGRPFRERRPSFQSLPLAKSGRKLATRQRVGGSSSERSEMGSAPNTKLWMASAFFASLALAAVVLASLGVDERGIHGALAATARLAFLFFWPAYAGSALVSLFGPAFQLLKRRGRQCGLAFASALLVHLGLVAWLCLFGAPPAFSVFAIFGFAAVWAYLLALCSWDRVRRRLPQSYWWVLNNIGMNYIAYAFAVDFLKSPLHGSVEHLVEYLPFAALAVAGPMARVAALARRFVVRSHE